MIARIFDDLDKFMKPGRATIIFGPRRVGKTTLIKNYLKQTKYKYFLGDGDDVQLQQILSSQDFSKILPFFREYELVVIDEAQRVPNIGMGLKIIVDQLPDLRVIATGSSSFDLRGQVGEPLVGRKIDLILYPVSQLELKKELTLYDLRTRLSDYLVFGGYPETLTTQTRREKAKFLEQTVNSYLLKDILEFERVKGSEVILNLLRLLAFQIGSEVSLSELGRTLLLDVKTVQRYIDILERSFIIKSLWAYSRNLRQEVNKKNKYYFWDNGIRNAIISNFNALELREDVGRLWENFLVIERLKNQAYTPIYANNYFWRTWDKKEVDWVEEREGKLFGFEFKWDSKKKARLPKLFLETYPNATHTTITPDNYFDFVA